MPFWPNAVGLQYGLHGLGWSQRLSVISRIKGAEQWPAFQKFAACKSESLTALTDSDCKLTALLQFTRDWIKLRFCIPSDIPLSTSRTTLGARSSPSATSVRVVRVVFWGAKTPAMDWGPGPHSIAGTFVVLRQTEPLHRSRNSGFNGQKQGLRVPL